MKKFFKVLILTLALWQALYSPSLSIVLAQEDSSEPTPAPTSEAIMTTGDATSDSSIQADTNISEVETTPSPAPSDSPEDSLISDPETTPTATPEAIPEDILAPTLTPTPDTISIDQSGSVSSDSSAGSNTGKNIQTSSGSAEMITGAAISSASNINITNLSSVDSNLITTVQTIYTGDSGDIDLYQLLESTIANNPNIVPTNTDITTTQSADVTANTLANSNTGENDQSADSTNMQTGDAISIASAINAVNLNLVGSNVILAIINILGDYSGNIVLPNGQTFSLASSKLDNVNVSSNQSTNVLTNTDANSNTGGNTQIGDTAEMTTGTSTSTSNTGSFINLIQIGGGWGYLVINNSGNWTGNLINWTAPGSIVTLPQGTTNLSSSWQGGVAGGNKTTNITSNQTASVYTNVLANSNTGKNTQTDGGSNLTTGNAFSLANNFTLANITGVGAGFLFGIINIFGNWTGNIISGPYVRDTANTDPVSLPTADPPADTRTPDLHIDTWNNVGTFVYPGDTVLANITVTNQSAFTAHNVEVKGQLTNDHPMPAIPMDWKIGDLRPNGKAKINFSITLTPNLPQGQYTISAIASGDGDSGNESSVNSISTFWVKVKGAIVEITEPKVLAGAVTGSGTGEVLGTTSTKKPLDINKYLPYILASLAAAYLFIFFARKKLKNEKN